MPDTYKIIHKCFNNPFNGHSSPLRVIIDSFMDTVENVQRGQTTRPSSPSQQVAEFILELMCV